MLPAVKVMAVKMGLPLEEYSCMPLEELTELFEVQNKLMGKTEDDEEDTEFFPSI